MITKERNLEVGLGMTLTLFHGKQDRFAGVLMVNRTCLVKAEL